MRFSRDKSPYKTQMGAVTEGEGGALYYVQLSATGLFAAAGYYVMASDQLERYRAAVVEDKSGDEVEDLVAGLEKAGYDVSAHDTLKTAPRGYPKDHARIALPAPQGPDAGEGVPRGRWLHTGRGPGSGGEGVDRRGPALQLARRPRGPEPRTTARAALAEFR